MKNKNNKQDGISILGVLVFGFILILILSYFHISIKSVVESPAGQENVNYVRGEAKRVWSTYFAKPISFFWNDVLVNIIWKDFISNMENMRDGKPTDFDNAVNNLKIQ
ncbi:MAG: hypothetical protein WC694_01450 [Candidatus Paceibacterota bacterium]|jgi:hypothetical protein